MKRRGPYDPRRSAETAVNAACEGYAPATAVNLLRFQFALLALALRRLGSLIRHNPRRLTHLGRMR